MGVDRTRLERLIAEQIDAVEAEHGEDWEIGDATCILEVKFPEGSEEVRVRSTGGLVSATGLVSIAQAVMQRENMSTERRAI